MVSKYTKEESIFSTIWNFLPGITKFLSVIGILIVGYNSLVLLGNTNQVQAEEDLLRPQNYTFGKEDASVQLFYFVDYQCPACRQNNPVITQIKDQYKDKVQFVYKHNPLSSIHPNAVPAARAVQAAGKQGKFIEFGDRLFANQDTGLGQANIEAVAKDLELNVEQWNKDRNSTEVIDIVRNDPRDIQEIELPISSISGQRKAKGEGTGTPTIVIMKNKSVIDWFSGGNDISAYQRILDAALES